MANDAAHDAPALAVRRVDDEGILLAGSSDVVVDVLFDDRRIWSFWSARDTEEAGDDLLAAWPGRLRRYLDGRTRLMVRTHVDGTVLFDDEVQLGSAEERIAVVNAQGQPLGMDKSGRLQVTFETRTAEDFIPLLDAIEEVLEALRKAGIEAFPAYGTLLGAVRQGGFIGHDSDADLGYVSRRTAPVDVIRESYALQRRLVGMGYQVSRYSGAGFAVRVKEGDGYRTLDVFGGFFSDGHLVVLGEVRVPFREEWIYPLGTTTLEGRTLPAPAEPERVLAAMYGPSWRVPDPAFVFTTPASTSRRLDDWFRGIVENRSDWDARFQGRLQRVARREGRVDPKPNRLATYLHRQEKDRDSVVVDVGCGYGHNAFWLASQGRRVEALDYSYRSFPPLAELAEERGLPASYSVMNLLEMRHVLAHGARVARIEGPKVVLARHLVDALPERGRDNLWRFLSMALRGGGRMYAEFLTHAVDDDPFAAFHMLTPVEVDDVAAELERIGGKVVSVDEVRVGPRPRGDAAGDAADAGDGDEDDGDHEEAARVRRGCRMVVEWPA